MSGRAIDKSPVAFGIPWDPDNDPNCDLTKENLQEVIEEICSRIQTSASPGFSYGRDGNLAANTWLLNEKVPSNKAGRWVYINNAVVRDVYVGSETVSTFDVAAYHHDGNEVNLTFINKVTVTSARGGKFSVNWAVPTDKQLSIRIENGSAKNCVVGLGLSGNV